MKKATRLYRNGTILTMDSAGSQVEAMTIAGDTILALGKEADLAHLVDANTLVTDLCGRTMLPGFIDGHSHITTAGVMYSRQIDLSSPPVGGIKNLPQLLDAIRERAASTPKGEWILGFGYDDTLLAENRHPLAADLDKAAPEHPVYLNHVSGHICTCNSLALKRGKVTAHTADPVGGVIRRNADGSPNGVLEEPDAMNMVCDQIPPLTEDDWMKALAVGSARYAAKGVTTAQDGQSDDMRIAMLKKARALEDSPLKVRVQILPGVTLLDLDQFTCTKSGTQLTKDCMLSLGAAKHFADGSIQCYTGYLSNPYHKVIYDLPGGPLWRGYPMESAYEMHKRIVDLHCKGWQIAVHGNGDDAIQMILDAFEEANKRYPRADARHIIMHCQTVREDQLDRIKRLGIVPSFFVVHTYYWGDRHYQTFLGPDRAERISPLKSAVNRGIVFSTHNDTFVTPMDPLLSVWSAVNRKTSGGRILGQAQCISVMDALRAVTNWAAYQACEEKIKGSLEPGKLADMVILKENPLTVPAETIKDIDIIATVVGGEVVHGSLD